MNLDEVMNRSTLTDLPLEDAIAYIGHACDEAWDAKRADVLRHLTTLSESFPRKKLGAEQVGLLDYFVGNLWNGIKLLESSGPAGGWEWENPSAEKEIASFRRAITASGISLLPPHRVCQARTNLGNCYSTIGRFVEAVDAWNDALTVNPRFGMARGNLGNGLWSYARMLYDDGHRNVLARRAWQFLDPARLEGLEAGAAGLFALSRTAIEKRISAKILREEIDLNQWSLGASIEEIGYRRWCLSARLFLNPLNDLGPYTIAARDVLTAPSIVTGLDEGPRFHGFFNQLKQEYVSARWLVYEALELADLRPHFSDRDVLLYNTLDYPAYSLATEKLRLGFRALYSCFDKIAFFLNAYLQLGIPEKRVSFRNLWYEQEERKNGVRAEFKARENLPLRGLFWLGKDLYEDSVDFRAAMDPEAEQLNEIRNHLEHKYLKLHDDLWSNDRSTRIFVDDLARSMQRGQFASMTMRLLSLTRAAIMYLSFGVHREERLRAQAAPQERITLPMSLDVWDDDWKR